MPLRDFVTGRTQNRILIGGVGVGLIISAVTYLSYVRPAFQIEQPDGDVLLTISDHGAIGVQNGSGVSFGDLDDCLKSGGSSGSTMTFGTCGSAGGAFTGSGVTITESLGPELVTNGSFTLGTRYTVPTANVSISPDRITISPDPGWVAGDIIHYGASGGTVITGLEDGDFFYVTGNTAGVITFSATSGGAAFNMTGVGNNNQFFVKTDWFAGTTGVTGGVPGWRVYSNRAEKQVAGTAQLRPAVPLSITPGKQYKVQYTVSNWTVAGTTVVLGGVTGQPNSQPTADGTYTTYITTNANTSLFFVPVTGMRADIDNVSVKEVKSKIASTGMTLVFENSLTSDTAHETAFVFSNTIDKADGDTDLLLLTSEETSAPGTDYLIRGFMGGTQRISISNAGAIVSASSISVTSVSASTTVTSTGNMTSRGVLSGASLVVSGPAAITGTLTLGRGATTKPGDLRMFTTGGGNYARIYGAGTNRTEVLYVGGTDGIYNFSNYLVGIGTTSPKARLDVVGTISGALITQNGAGDNYFRGSLGINTTSAATQLHVNRTALNEYADATYSGQPQAKQAWFIDNRDDGLISGLEIRNTNASGLAFAGIGLSLGTGTEGGSIYASRTVISGYGIVNGINITPNDVSQDIGFRVGSAALGGTANGPQFILQGSTSNVGINTSTPKAKLDVVGSISGALITQNGAGDNYFMGGIGIGNSSLLPLSAGNGAASQTPSLQVLGTGADDSSIGVARFSNSANGPKFIFLTSRNTTIGGKTIVQSNDSLGQLIFSADNGVDYLSAGAKIEAIVDGTPGASSLPTRMVFSTTPTGLESPVERVRITNAGRIGIGASSPAAQLSVSGSLVLSAQGNVVDSRAAKATLDVVGTVSGSTIYTANLQRPLEGCIAAYGPTTAVSTGTGGSFDIPASATGSRLYLMRISHDTTGNGKTSLKVERSRPNAAATAYVLTSMLTTNISTDSGEYNSTTAATPYVVATTEAARVQGGDRIAFNVTEVPGTPPNGLRICFTFLPK